MEKTEVSGIAEDTETQSDTKEAPPDTGLPPFRRKMRLPVTNSLSDKYWAARRKCKTAAGGAAALLDTGYSAALPVSGEEKS